MPKANKSASKSPTKSDFIRKFSASTPASDIVAKAKSANLKLTPSFVYAIRAMDKKRKGGTGKVGRPPSVATSAAPSAAPATSGKSVNKSAWVRSLPASMSASEVIAKGKAQGIKLTAAQVYTVRANAKRSGDAAPAKAKGKPGPKPGAKKASVATSGSNGASHDHHFVNLVLNIGLSKAEALLARVREKMTSGL